MGQDLGLIRRKLLKAPNVFLLLSKILYCSLLQNFENIWVVFGLNGEKRQLRPFK